MHTGLLHFRRPLLCRRRGKNPLAFHIRGIRFRFGVSEGNENPRYARTQSTDKAGECKNGPDKQEQRQFTLVAAHLPAPAGLSNAAARRRTSPGGKTSLFAALAATCVQPPCPQVCFLVLRPSLYDDACRALPTSCVMAVQERVCRTIV